eukprot:1785929-Karenia_brevis.AAC.1
MQQESGAPSNIENKRARGKANKQYRTTQDYMKSKAATNKSSMQDSAALSNAESQHAMRQASKQ